MTNIVSEGRRLRPGNDAISKLGKMVTKPFARFAPKAIMRYFIYLPLNFVPFVGTVMFVSMQGKRFGPSAHARYFQLKKMDKTQRESFVEERQAAYAR